MHPGTNQLNLAKLPTPAKSSAKCKLPAERDAETVDLFQLKNAYGWWPVTASKEDGTIYISVCKYISLLIHWIFVFIS